MRLIVMTGFFSVSFSQHAESISPDEQNNEDQWMPPFSHFRQEHSKCAAKNPDRTASQ